MRLNHILGKKHCSILRSITQAYKSLNGLLRSGILRPTGSARDRIEQSRVNDS